MLSFFFLVPALAAVRSIIVVMLSLPPDRGGGN